MLYLLFGPETYLRDEFVVSVCNKHKLSAKRISSNSTQAEDVIGGDLFSPVSVMLILGINKDLVTGSALAKMKASPNHIIFWEEKLDKRLLWVKELMADKSIEKIACETPSGVNLLEWVKLQFTDSNIKTDDGVAEELVNRVSGQEKDNTFSDGLAPEYSLTSIKNEIEKLVTFSNGETVTKEMVQLLVAKKIDAHVFSITEAIGQKNISLVFRLYEKFFSDSDSTDTKGKTILLNSLLAEQFRSLLVVQGFSSSVGEGEIIAQTGWKPGRVKILKKIAGKFETKKILEILNKLENLDIELKTGSVPPRVLLDMITAQIS